ncbi:hypothetical protein POJ06DRAFT_244834 [Lipomyces tetrasporus]|uniref:Uncharacterized protein n=1 Tax=Lipomyces tetrasporus TaxID=54092 RepID=A0AAD7QX29_9ASCO|nr:uncharacterized protein POJ06DRAFT_244834 [Lipomyces tetrasporus]KAJ8102501.1 hypothetical protein POJ06DRAFT_244834 [Lipomyces tetrasporus]
MEPSQFPISEFASADVPIAGGRRALEDHLTDTELAQLISFMQPSTEPENDSASESSAANEADDERDASRLVLDVFRNSASGGDAVVEGDAASESGRSGYSTSIVDSDDDEDEIDPFYNLRKNIHALYMIAVMVDLRAEQTYMRSIAKAEGSALGIAWITFKDQVLVQFAQGLGLKLLKILLVPWFRGTMRSGESTGSTFRTKVLGFANYLGKRLSLIPKPR